MATKRIAYLDMARGLGMVLVVMGHVEYINMSVRQFIAAFHMPLFFLISGILIWEKDEEEKEFIGIIKKKLYSIMLPYVIFSLLSFCIEGGRLALKGLEGWDVVLRQLFQSFCLQGVSTLWFLPALFISELVFVGIRKKTSHRGTVLGVGTIVLMCAILNTYEKALYQMYAESLYWGLVHDILSMVLRNFFCVGFIAMGYYIRRLLRNRVTGVIPELLSLLLFTVTGTFTILFNRGVDLRYMELGFLPLYLLGAISGSMVIILLCRLLERIPCNIVKRIMEFYGRNSLIVMVTHMDFRVLYCSIRLASVFHRQYTGNGFFCILIVIFVFVLEIPIIWFLNKFMPFAIGRKLKNS